MPFWDRFRHEPTRPRGDAPPPQPADDPAATLKKQPGGTDLRIGEPSPAALPHAPAQVPSLDLADGARLADTYRIERRIGAGGMGTVYLARHERWNLDVVLKVPKAEILADPEHRHRTTREAEAWTDLGLHPHVAYCYYVHPIAEVPVLVIEYLAGGNLREWIQEGRCADLRSGLNLAIQFCHGLEHAHRQGLIHRDIKPENILLTPEGALKITDFGIARASEAIPEAAGSRSLVAVPMGAVTVGGIGTYEYMAPEQFVSAHEVDARVDIFAFGVCLYEMFCGRRPYDVAVAAGLPPEPRELRGNGDLSPMLCELMQRCVHPDRTRRPSTAREVREALSVIYSECFQAVSEWATLSEISLEADGWNNRGVSYLELKQEQRAAECFEKALEANPAHLESTYNLAKLEWRRGRLNDLEAVWKLGQLAGMPGVDPQALAVAKAEIHQQRIDVAASRAELVPYPGLYESCFGSSEAVPGGDTVRLRRVSDAPSILLNQDGRRALIADGSRLTVLNIETGETLCELSDGELRAPISATRDLRFALSASHDNKLKLWDLISGKCVRSFGGQTPPVSALALSDDCRWALSGSAAQSLEQMFTFEAIRDKIVKGENITIGPHSLKVVNQRGTLHSVEAIQRFFTPEQLSSAIGEIRLWALETGECVRTYPAHPLKVMAVAFGTDAARAASAGWDGTLKFWNLESGEYAQALMSRSAEALRAAAFSLNGKHAVSCDEKDQVRLWDLQGPCCVRTFNERFNQLSALGLAGDGGSAVLADWDQRSSGWNVVRLDLGSRPSRPPTPTLCRPQPFIVLRDRQQALTAALSGVSALLAQGRCLDAYNALIQLWEPLGFGMDPVIWSLYRRLYSAGTIDRPLSVQPRSWVAHGGRVLSVALGADGRCAFSGGYDQVLKLWDVHARTCVRSFEDRASPIRVVAMNSNCSRGFAAGDQGMLRVWDLATGRCTNAMAGEPYQEVALAADSDLALSGANDGTLKLWDLVRGQPLLTFRQPQGGISTLAFASDGEAAISVSGGSLAYWEPGKALRSTTTRLRQRMVAVLQAAVDKARGQTEFPSSPIDPAAFLHVAHSAGSFQTMLKPTVVALSADGRQSVIGTQDGGVHVWDFVGGKFRGAAGSMGTGSRPASTSSNLSDPRAAQAIRAVRLLGKGPRVLSGGDDGSMKVWNLESERPLTSMTTPSPLLSLDATADGLSALSGHADGTLTHWRIIWSLEFPDQARDLRNQPHGT